MIVKLLFAQPEKGEVIIISEKVGDKIDPEERTKYNLFPATRGFQSAVIFKMPDGTYDFELTYIEESSGEEKQYRINQSQSQFNQLRNHIETPDESQRRNTKIKEDDNIYTSGNKLEKETHLQTHSFYLGKFARSQPMVSFRDLHPLYEDYKYSYFSSYLAGVYDYNLNTPINSELNLIIDFPIVVEAVTDQSQYIMGNIFIGFQTRDDTRGKTIQSTSVGFFLPTSGSIYYRRRPNYYELPKYMPSTLTLQLRYMQQFTWSAVSHFGFEITPHFLISTYHDFGRHIDLFLNYGAFMDYNLHALVLRCELIGSLWLTSYEEKKFNPAIASGISYKKISLFYTILLSEPDYYVKLKHIVGIRLNFFLKSFSMTAK